MVRKSGAEIYILSHFIVPNATSSLFRSRDPWNSINQLLRDCTCQIFNTQANKEMNCVKTQAKRTFSKKKLNDNTLKKGVN